MTPWPSLCSFFQVRDTHWYSLTTSFVIFSFSFLTCPACFDTVCSSITNPKSDPYITSCLLICLQLHRNNLKSSISKSLWSNLQLWVVWRNSHTGTFLNVISKIAHLLEMFHIVLTKHLKAADKPHICIKQCTANNCKQTYVSTTLGLWQQRLTWQKYIHVN